MMALNAIIALYVTAQTELLKPASLILWGFITVLIFGLSLKRSAKLVLQPHDPITLLLLGLTCLHALAFHLLIGETMTGDGAGLEILKVLLVFLCLAILRSQEDIRMAVIGMADTAIAATSIIALLGYLGVIPSTTWTWFERSRDALGFWNPNVALGFIFPSAIAYTCYSRRRRLTAALAIAILIGIAGALSRTFFAAITLLWLGVMSGSFGFTRRLADYAYFAVACISMLFGTVSYMTALFAQEFLQGLVLSPIDLILSFRISLLADYFMVKGEGPLGFVLLRQDSLYFELLFIFGLPFCFLYVREFLRRFGHRDDLAQRNVFLALSVVSIAGLAESMLLTITVGSMLLLLLIFSPNSFDRQIAQTDA